MIDTPNADMVISATISKTEYAMMMGVTDCWVDSTLESLEISYAISLTKYSREGLSV